VPGLGGVRIENTCAITENGGRTLVHAQKALLIL
jgi:Xaa-Pro aminopeptidase